MEAGAKLGESSWSVCSGEKSQGPSSTTRVGIPPLPCSMETTFSWEQFLQRQVHQERGSQEEKGWK